MVPVVSPNNPTGACVTGAQLREAAARAPGVLWVVDQAYAEYGGEDLTEVALGLENAVVLRTFSKAWGLAGLRVGYVLGPAEVIEWLRAAGLPFAVSGPSLALAQAWLERGEGEVRRHVARVASERARLREVFEGLGCEAQPSEANFVLSRVPDPVWLRDALAGLGVGIRVWPGSAELGDAARVTCPGEEGDFARLEAALGAALRPEALLLDMDGVMADVSASYRGAIVQTAARFGASVTAQDIAQAKARGGANDDWALTQRLLAERGVQVGLDEVTEVFEALYQGTDASPGLRHTERLIGGRGLYEALAARVPLAVVTGRPRVDAERFLSEHGLGGLFGAVVCREDAPLKPDPAPVREALSRLGVSRAWMVGDTPDDVRAARSAGVVPLGVVAPGEAGAWEAGASVLRRAGAGRVLGRLDELVAMLGEAR
jgi:HAD superfamily hydrolase (TIGR01548 family)